MSESKTARNIAGAYTWITDFQDPRLNIYCRLPEVQLLRYREPELGIFIAESAKVIERALHAGYEPLSFLTEVDADGGTAAQEQQLFARCPDVPVYAARKTVFEQIRGFQMTRGMLCAMNRRPLVSVEEVCHQARRIAVLEGVVNPTNIGAIVRSAAALGMDAVLFAAGCCDPLYRRAARVSMGTIFQIPWTFGGSGVEIIQQLGAFGFCTVAMALRDDSIALDDARLRGQEKLAVVFGAEGDGLTEQTIEACAYTVRIPMAHGVDSLNVAAASAVAFWELGKYKK